MPFLVQQLVVNAFDIDIKVATYSMRRHIWWMSSNWRWARSSKRWVSIQVRTTSKVRLESEVVLRQLYWVGVSATLRIWSPTWFSGSLGLHDGEWRTVGFFHGWNFLLTNPSGIRSAIFSAGIISAPLAQRVGHASGQALGFVLSRVFDGARLGLARAGRATIFSSFD